MKKTGLEPKDFQVTKYGVDKYGKSVPVEYRSKNGAEVSIDYAHDKNGPDAPHVGWQGPGKKNDSGHIMLDEVPAGRSNDKQDRSQF